MRKPFLADYPLTQGFAKKFYNARGEDVYAKYELDGHNGLDYGLPSGTPILSPHEGKILEVANDPSGYGLYVKVESIVEGSVLAHMASFAVSIGQQVQEGQLLGYSDNTGNSTGAHLHWGWYKIPRNRQNGYAGFIDQTPFIGQVISSQQPPMDNADEKAHGQYNEIAHFLFQIGKLTSDDSNQYLGNGGVFGAVKNMAKDLKDCQAQSDIESFRKRIIEKVKVEPVK